MAERKIIQPRSQLLSEVCEAVLKEGRYYSILGSKLIGKTTFLKQIKRKIEAEHPSFKCVYVDLGELRTASSNLFYHDFVYSMNRELKRDNTDIKAKVFSMQGLDTFITSLLKPKRENITLLLDEIEHVPEYLTRDLLEFFRVMHQGRSRDAFLKYLCVIISGSTNLLEFTLEGPNSPFNIAHPILLSDLGHHEAEEFIDQIMSQHTIEIETAAKQQILQETNGHPYLISKICFACAEEMVKDKIKSADIIKIIDHFVANYKEDDFFSFIIKKLENDRDIFGTLVEILKKGYSKTKAVALTIGKHELTGAFIRENNTFKIRNNIIKKLLIGYFDNVRKGDVSILLGEWERALVFYQTVDHPTRMKGRRADNIPLSWQGTIDIVNSISNLMYSPGKDTETILKYLLDGIYYVLSYDSVGLYTVNREHNNLKLDDFRGRCQLKQKIEIKEYSQEIEIRAYNAKRFVVEDKNEANNFAVAFPLTFGGNDIRWVLSINNYNSRLAIKNYECEELNIFTNNALIAIRNARSYYQLYKEKEAILDAMGEELSITDKDYNILYMNTEKIAKIGEDYPNSEEKCYKVFARKEKPCDPCCSIEAIEKGRTIRRDDYHIEYHRDGKIHYVLQTASPLRDEEGNCVKAVKVVRDVTKRKKLYEIIEKLQEELDLDKIISIIMEGIKDLGYQRARFYEYIERQKSRFIVGVTSMGMEHFTEQFSGYRINLNEIYYINFLLEHSEPKLYCGDAGKPEFRGKKWIKDLGLENMQWMDLPLISRNKLIGVIGIDNKGSASDLKSEDLDMMAILAGYAAQAIDNSRFFQRQKILYEVSRAISQTLDIQELQKNIVHKICEVFRAEICSIFLFDEKKNFLTRSAIYLKTKEGWSYKTNFDENYEIGTYITGKVYQKGIPQIIDDIKKYTQKKNTLFIKEYEEILNSGEVRNVIFTPVTFRKEKIGIIRVANKLTEGEDLSNVGFKQDDLELLVSLAEQSAVALANSKLFENQKKSIKQLQMLTEISNLIQKEEELDKIFYTILAGLSFPGGLEFNRAVLLLVNQKEGKLRGQMGVGPANKKEAGRIWDQDKTKISDQQEKEKSILTWINETYDKESFGSAFNNICKNIEINLDDRANILVRSIHESKSFSYEDCQNNNKAQLLKEVESECWAIAPLIVDDKPIGLIYVDNRFNKHQINAQSIEILKLFANQAAVAIHNSNLYAEKGKQLNGIEALNRIISMITSCQDLEDIYKTIKTEPRRIFPNIKEMCLLVKNEDESFKPVISCPRKNTKECEDCKHHERELIFQKGRYKEYYCPDAATNRTIKKNLKTRFIIPLVFENQLLGIFDIGSEIKNAFSEFDRKLLLSLGSQIAIAINNRSRQKKQIEILRDISHSLNTYLSTIRAYSQRLSEGEVKDESKKEHYIKTVSGDVLHLSNLVNTISNLAKIECGTIKYNIKKIELNDVINEVVEKNKFALEEKQLRFTLPEGDKKIFIKGDRERMHEVFEIFIHNAIKFSKNKKSITVTTKAEGEQVIINIKDEGVGIHKKDLPNIFNKYFRGQYAREQQIEGTGIGLTIANMIIEKHNGEISVDSTLRTGTTVTISLPGLL
jgi:signal transduction histidine kinase/PAS domain-containing protein